MESDLMLFLRYRRAFTRQPALPPDPRLWRLGIMPGIFSSGASGEGIDMAR